MKYGHDPEGECDSRLLFFLLRDFPITCDNERDPVSYETLKPFVARDSIVYEFAPDGSTTCWDAASLYMTLCAMRERAGGQGPYRHPIHGCIVPFPNVELVYLTARTSGPLMRAAMKKMMWDIATAAVAGTRAVVTCLATIQLCAEPMTLLHPLQRLVGVTVTDDLAKTILHATVTSAGMLSAVHSGIAGYCAKRQRDKQQEYGRRLDKKKASESKWAAYGELKRKRRGKRSEDGAQFARPSGLLWKQMAILTLRRVGLPNELIREIGRRAELPRWKRRRENAHELLRHDVRNYVRGMHVSSSPCHSTDAVCTSWKNIRTNARS
jgi:hypothetical protein